MCQYFCCHGGEICPHLLYATGIYDMFTLMFCFSLSFIGLTMALVVILFTHFSIASSESKITLMFVALGLGLCHSPIEGINK